MAGDSCIELRFIVPTDPEYALAAELRYDTLYAGWGLPRELIADVDGREYRHLIAVDDGRVIGYARMWLADGHSQVFQVAVAADMRNRGVGVALMRELIDVARREGRAEVVLDAREHVCGFYEKLGFEPAGAVFRSSRTGTPHIPMRLKLR